MNDLLKQGLNIESKNHHGLTATQVAMAQHHVDMVQFLLMNGSSDVASVHTHDFSSSNMNEMPERHETEHRIRVYERKHNEVVLRGHEGEKKKILGRIKRQNWLRVSIYRDHPLVRREKGCFEGGKVIRLPSSLEDLKIIAGKVSIFS